MVESRSVLKICDLYLFEDSHQPAKSGNFFLLLQEVSETLGTFKKNAN